RRPMDGKRIDFFQLGSITFEKPDTEKELRVSPELRQVRLDVVSMDLQKKVYHTEMQKSDTGNLKKRSRYYQAQLDVSLLEPGCIDFNLLNDSCFILIAPFDLFNEGLYRYTFEGTCRECPKLKLEDGATRVFINTKGTNKEEFSQEFLDFMEYIMSSTDAVADRTASSRIKLIHENVKKIRASEKMGVKYMQLWEEKALIREEGRREGRSEGIEVGKAEMLVNSVGAAMKNFGIDLQSACEGIGTTVEEYYRAKEDRGLKG
ncbi:MAG: Rpn family recombination-promoting nuclease/putative transposase, partial [Lachnospiraceae bacterium]|nr:Rpn family recombination-promoting nuclease/putative transposase [Lachnospiraceae bacterium]